MFVPRKPKLLACALLGVFILSFTQVGCKKADIAYSEDARPNISSSDLIVYSATNPKVQKVLTEFNKRNAKSEFIKSFTTKYGTPVWNKGF